jgi:hypothetical protein
LVSVNRPSKTHHKGNIVFKKTLTIAAPLIATATIATAVLTAGTTTANAGKQDPNDSRPAAVSHKASSNKCDGGAQKKTWNRGTNGWIFADNNSPTVVPGSTIRIKGPSQGHDALNVNLSAHSWMSSSVEGRVKVTLDGVPLAPSDLSTGSVFYTEGYGTFAQNYCKNIGPGFHNLKVELSVNDWGQAGTYYFELKDPMINVEQAE